MNTVRRPKPDWMHDCKYIDELADGEIGYTLSGAFVQAEDNSWWIARDQLCSPIRRGTHDTMFFRDSDIIYVREGKMDGNYTSYSLIHTEDNSFLALFKPFALEEKVEILWNERSRR